MSETKVSRKTEDREDREKIISENITPQQGKINISKYDRILAELEETELLFTYIKVQTREDILSNPIKIDDPTGSPLEPKTGSLYDPRIGTSIENRACSTCHNYPCIGHDGVIEFPENYPIVNPLWMSLVINILRCVCNNCGALLVSQAEIENAHLNKLGMYLRVPKIAELSKKRKCMFPNRRQSGQINSCFESGNVKPCEENPEYVNYDQKDYRILKKEEGGTKLPLNPLLIYKIFTCIKDQDVSLLGMENGMRPENLIMFGIAVMPSFSRLHVYSKTTGAPMLNDITRSYEDIIKSVNRMKEKPSDENLKYLFMNVKHLMEGKKTKNKTAKVRMSILSSLQGKKSALRNTLMGKSTNRCARTVIGPDTSLRLTEVGIPKKWAEVITITEYVTHSNRHFLEKLFNEGKITHIVDSEGPRKGFRRTVRVGETSFPRIGSKVYRYMLDDDIVVLNRQPTLHKFGMMGFHAKFRDQENITFHVSVTTPYNADYDGDEMNMWIADLLGARAEAQEIMFVSANAQSTTKNKPNMGLVYDAITASFLLTDEERIDPGLYFTIRDRLTQTAYLADLDERLKKYHIHPLSGKGVFSMVFPPDFNYFNGDVMILDGVLIQGRLTADHVSHSGGSIVEKLIMEYGQDEFIDFLTDSSYMVLEYITETGFTVGISDCMEMDKEEREIEEADTRKLKEKIQSEVDILPPPTPESSTIFKETYEKGTSEIVKKHETAGFSTIKEKIRKTGMGEMMSETGGGAKGKFFNYRQIRKFLAAQFYRGKRLAGPGCPIRATPGYDVGETDIRAAGFITSNFMQGLSPDEHFMHMLAGREGLIDTAINVRAIGDLHRKIIKSMENLSIGINGSVMNNIGTVFQLVYGGDGLDPGKLIKIKPKGSTESFASFIDPFDHARNINSRKGWIPYRAKIEIEKRKTKEEKKKKEFEQKGKYFSDLEEEIENLKTGRGRGLGSIPEKQGNRGIQNRRLEGRSNTLSSSVSSSSSASASLSSSASSSASTSASSSASSSASTSASSSKKTVSSKPSTEKREIKLVNIESPSPISQSVSKKSMVSEKPSSIKYSHPEVVQIDSRYIAKTMISLNSLKMMEITNSKSFINGKYVLSILDNQLFHYGTFVRGLKYFTQISKQQKQKGIVSSIRSDSPFLGIISYLCSLAKINPLFVVRMVDSDEENLRIAQNYGAEIIQNKESEQSNQRHAENLSKKRNYQLVNSNLDQQEYVQLLAENLQGIVQKFKIQGGNIYIVKSFECILKAMKICFPDRKVSVLTSESNVQTDDIVWYNL